MLVGFLVTLDVLVCFLLIVVVLMQSGKGGVSGAFGIGGASQTLFGAGQAGNVLTKGTWILGGCFLGLSLLIALLGGPSSKGVGRQSILQPTARPAATSLPPVGTPPSTGGTSLPGEIPAAGGAPAGSAAPPATTPATTVPATGASNPPPAGTPPAGGH